MFGMEPVALLLLVMTTLICCRIRPAVSHWMNWLFTLLFTLPFTSSYLVHAVSLLVLNICVFTQDYSSASQENIAPTCLPSERPTDPHPLGQPSTFIRPLAIMMIQFGNTTQIQLLRVHFLIPTYHNDSICCLSSRTDSSPPIPIYDLPAPY